MKATILFRITAFVFHLFAAGHTFGFLSFKPPTPEGLAVIHAMDSVQFVAQGKAFTYGGWYRGFGLTATVSMLFESFLAWQLGAMARRGSSEVTVLGWGFFVWQLPGLVLSLIYFGVAPMVLSALVAVLIAAATWLSPKPAAVPQFERQIRA